MAAVVDKRRDSLSQVAYDQIKTMILQKDLTPGQFINEAQLQALLGLGRTPVREAVLALAQDKLVHIHPRKGIEISRPTLKEAGNAGQTAAPLIELDNEFHLKLVDTLHNQYASQLMRSLTEYLNLIRITAWRPSRYQVSNREHIDILNAILERRPEDACRLLSEHIQLSYQEAINTMIHCSF